MVLTTVIVPSAQVVIQPDRVAQVHPNRSLLHTLSCQGEHAKDERANQLLSLVRSRIQHAIFIRIRLSVRNKGVCADPARHRRLATFPALRINRTRPLRDRFSKTLAARFRSSQVKGVQRVILLRVDVRLNQLNEGATDSANTYARRASHVHPVHVHRHPRLDFYLNVIRRSFNVARRQGHVHVRDANVMFNVVRHVFSQLMTHVKVAIRIEDNERPITFVPEYTSHLNGTYIAILTFIVRLRHLMANAVHGQYPVHVRRDVSGNASRARAHSMHT